MVLRPGTRSPFDGIAPSEKKKLTAAKFKLLARACADNDLGAGSVYRVLIYSIEKANGHGAFWKKNSTIAREVGIDRSTVIEAMNRLTIYGYIERIGRHNGRGNSANLYVLALDLGGSIKAAIREARRRAKYSREQVANNTGNPLPRCSETPTPGVVIPRPQESSNRHTYTSLPMNPSPEPLGSASLEGKKQVARQGSGEGIEDGTSIGENVASGTIPLGKPSSLFPDDATNTLGPSTSSLAEPLSSIWTADRLAPGADGVDHAQRSLGPILVITGGLEKMEAEVLGIDELAPLKAAKKSAIDTIGKLRFVERDIELDRRFRLAAVPANVRDGVRRLQYLAWAAELAEEQHAATTPAAAGGAA